MSSSRGARRTCIDDIVTDRADSLKKNKVPVLYLEPTLIIQGSTVTVRADSLKTSFHCYIQGRFS